MKTRFAVLFSSVCLVLGCGGIEDEVALELNEEALMVPGPIIGDESPSTGGSLCGNSMINSGESCDGISFAGCTKLSTAGCYNITSGSSTGDGGGFSAANQSADQMSDVLESVLANMQCQRAALLGIPCTP